ncbi:hypothetical protein [Nonomuraea soli]|uniref:Uncharacterized protein n=1 Tax=Nonomuraea soli TaxID=1032476 RepID=A0A7W0HW46_9ACTN|nr:hypothetical protein [Nonomuraea soli]MBA2897878.1 hypothetical protein [Nonomuraea soli]
MALKDARIEEILDALDTRWPQVSYRVKTFPEGQRHARLRHPGGGRAILFVHEQQWVCLSESASGVEAEGILGRVDEPAEAIADRLRFVAPRPPRSRWPHTLLAVSLGLVCAVAVGSFTASLLIVLAGGHRYTEAADLYRWIVATLAVMAGISAGSWATWVIGIRGRRTSP